MKMKHRFLTCFFFAHSSTLNGTGAAKLAPVSSSSKAVIEKLDFYLYSY